LTHFGQKPIGGVQLPTNPAVDLGRETYGFVTPAQDLMPQRFSVPPRRVIPIVFIPGIMGSNLRLKKARQDQLEQDDNMAWRPDSTAFCLRMVSLKPFERQKLLDPSMTEVDEYDPAANTTGNDDETADERNSHVKLILSYGQRIEINTPLLSDDPPTHPKRRTREQKARERGWGEVYFSSYGTVLQLCEEKLNSAFRYGQLDPWWDKKIVGVSPSAWQATQTPPLSPIDETLLKKIFHGCWYPVHALGYNWLDSNERSGVKTGMRVAKLIDKYRQQGFQCEKVIVVTHSMGGLVARAMVHPEMGNMHDQVLGIVHGVMPAIGAPATYKRMRCGFEGVAAKVLGPDGPSVTAVLANAQGGLELLPSCAYGNSWLMVKFKKQTILDLPQRGDPYEEIYKLRNHWYQLLNEEWINPAKLRGPGISTTYALLDKAKAFHRKIGGYYHANSYAHYGTDADRKAWQTVTWGIQSAEFTDVHQAKLVFDSATGTLRLQDVRAPVVMGMGAAHSIATLQSPSDAGDETVPAFSADDQLRTGKLKGIFRQTGYEHQGSYKADSALCATLYSIVKIAETMRWEK
jgi:hypothetical protein